MNTLYKTELDGMKTILTDKKVSNDEFVFIKDDLFSDEITLFKNKQTKKDQLDLKLVKLADITLLSENEKENFKTNQLYFFSNTTFTSKNRLNKNQIIYLNDSFYTIEEVIKHKDQPLEPVLKEISYVLATNVYTILKREKESKNEYVFGRYHSYSEALSTLWKLRESRDGNYYRFP